MTTTKKRIPIERPTARKMVDELLEDEVGAEVGAVVVGGLTEEIDELPSVVKAEDGSAEASSLRRTLMQSKE